MKHPKHYDTDVATQKRMAKVKLKRGDAERILAKELWKEGFRYRLNDKRLPGSPDIAILKYEIAVFIDGEFWHGQDWEKRKNNLKSNREYWIEKIEENIARDERVVKQLKNMGWKTVRFWEKDVLKKMDECVYSILRLIE